MHATFGASHIQRSCSGSRATHLAGCVLDALLDASQALLGAGNLQAVVEAAGYKVSGPAA
jgi:hypothetical protein